MIFSSGVDTSAWDDELLFDAVKKRKRSYTPRLDLSVVTPATSKEATHQPTKAFSIFDQTPIRKTAKGLALSSSTTSPLYPYAKKTSSSNSEKLAPRKNNGLALSSSTTSPLNPYANKSSSIHSDKLAPRKYNSNKPTVATSNVKTNQKSKSNDNRPSVTIVNRKIPSSPRPQQTPEIINNSVSQEYKWDFNDGNFSIIPSKSTTTSTQKSTTTAAVINSFAYEGKKDDMIFSTPLDARIRKELAECAANASCGVMFVPVNSNIHKLSGEILGSEGTPYEGGVFEISIDISDGYPYKPPKMKFITKIWHPNISSQTGAIGLDILKTLVPSPYTENPLISLQEPQDAEVESNWSPALTIETTLLSLQSLLHCPEPTKPQDEEVAKMYINKRTEFDATAKFWTETYAQPKKESISFQKCLVSSFQK